MHPVRVRVRTRAPDALLIGNNATLCIDAVSRPVVTSDRAKRGQARDEHGGDG